MADIILVGTRDIPNTKCLITNKIVFLPIKHDLEGITALIFTSRYGILSLLDSERVYPKLSRWREIPCFVIGKKSAETLQSQSAYIAYIGKGSSGEAFARDIIPLLSNKKPLYFRAKVIISKLDEILINAKIPLQQYIAYQNIPQTLDKSQKPKPHSILIFSSPSAYKSFTNQFQWDKSYTAIAIGESTFKMFDENIVAFLSPESSIESALVFANNIFNTQRLKS